MRVGSEDYGPYTGREIETFADEGRIEGSTEVRRVNGEDWIPARTDMALKKFFGDGKPPVVAPRRTPESTMPQGDGNVVVNVQNGYTAQQPQQPVAMGADKSPALACILSLLIVGLGQMYNGRMGKGIAMLLGAIVLWAILLGWIIQIWSVIDAYSEAKSKRTLWRRYHGIADA